MLNAHALSILEFDRVLSHVARYAHSAPGAAAVRSLQPIDGIETIESEFRRVAAMRALVSGEPAWSAEQVPDIGTAIARLRIEGTSWTGGELLGASILLRSSRRTRDALSDVRRNAMARAVLADYAKALIVARSEEDALTRALNDDGSLKDDASPELRRIRQSLKRAEGELVRILEREMARLDTHHQVGDASVTMRNGRWVIPVRKEARTVVGGLVHDTSGTGATIFVEPPAAVEFGNRIRELENEELRESERIFRELTAMLHPMYIELGNTLAALIALDCLLARARYAESVHAGEITVVKPSEGMELIHGRHPLLLAQGVNVVPFSLALNENEKTLLISGPNTGGKTVLLKAIGLISVMVRCGLPVPVAGGSRVPVFDNVYADVGDEQSLEASLSTFSAHLKNQSIILESATSESLVLMDEVGSGTDPLEGAALGGAILETLTQRGTTSIATTHLGQLKLLATEVVGVVNASLQFDAARMEPTYRLLKGVPGRSYGITIARRLGIASSVVELAESRLPEGERDMGALLAQLELKEAELDVRENEASKEAQRILSRMAAVKDREVKVREKEREQEKLSRQEARKYLLEARAEVERVIASVKAVAEEESLVSKEDQFREARRTLEDAALHQKKGLQEIDKRSSKAVGKATKKDQKSIDRNRYTPVVGDPVLVATLGNKNGSVVEIRGSQARVLVGSVTMTVPVSSLSPADPQPPPAIRITVRGDMPESNPKSEVDVRGMRVDELDNTVMQALDSAVRNDLPELRIIHGKGTGVLRERVADLMKSDNRVTSFRPGAWNEGGVGVTIADLR